MRAKDEIAAFWNAAFVGGAINMVVPTSIVCAIRTEPAIEDGKLVLSWSPPVDPAWPLEQQLQGFAREFLADLEPRFEADDLALLRSTKANPGQPLPQQVLGSNWLLESALVVAQMASDSDFIVRHGVDEGELRELVSALDHVTRPALVVDGQHRLLGAASSDHADDIRLPVVAIESASWLDQAFQFIVINETAQPVDPSVLQDIIGSSITPREQILLRGAVNAANLNIEKRIAATVVDRDANSPFHGMIKIRIFGGDQDGNRPFQASTINRLISDPIGGSRAWRLDGEFIEEYVLPSGVSDDEWSDPLHGVWKEYFYCFWGTVRDYYAGTPELWDHAHLTPLTKALMLRSLQTVFMEDAIAKSKLAARDMTELDEREERYRAKYEPDSETLAQLLQDVADERREKRFRLPEDAAEFKGQVEAFLVNVPRRVFEKHLNLQDAGRDREAVLELLRDIIDKEKRGAEWRRSGPAWAEDYTG
jgi:hypothetical protein